VRASIGAALEEAALDPFLTGREHVRLQASLHGIRGEARTTGLDPQSRSALWEEVGGLAKDEGVTVFLAKTGRSLEGAQEEEAAEE
jgi:ABC-2 type transport system ATP-binding protein